MQCLQVLESFFSSDDFVRRLTTLEMMGDFAMLLLTFVAST